MPLAKISVFIVPLERRVIWPFRQIMRHSNRRSVKSSVLLAIVEDISHSVAHNKTIIGVNRGVASVENTMDIFAKQDSVGLGVRPSFRVRTNVRGIQRW